MRKNQYTDYTAAKKKLKFNYLSMLIEMLDLLVYRSHSSGVKFTFVTLTILHHLFYFILFLLTFLNELFDFLLKWPFLLSWVQDNWTLHKEKTPMEYFFCSQNMQRKWILWRYDALLAKESSGACDMIFKKKKNPFVGIFLIVVSNFLNFFFNFASLCYYAIDF